MHAAATGTRRHDRSGLITFPLGALGAAAICDVAHALGAGGGLALASFWLVALGAALGMIAAIIGVLDWTGSRPGSLARRLNATRAGVNVLLVGLFAMSWALRLAQPAAPPLEALLAGGAALPLALFGGRLGGVGAG